ncbi:ferredoxin [Mycobacterium avium]|uniref:ferredoxin n=1 Tax=Mycobacterium avium TaxID=1764 RepID=UPI001CCE8F30|nr:ferredoxin [Mycobacterium avium]MBZ4571685.1 ferredoxin [Mycobacterium avium subsp. hominissuis]
MRVRVDPRLCEAHALCVEIAPEVFRLDDDTASCADDPAESLRHSVQAAVAACPRQAISVLTEQPPYAPDEGI